MPAPLQATSALSYAGATSANTGPLTVSAGSSLLVLVALGNIGGEVDPLVTVNDGAAYTASVYKPDDVAHRTVGLFYRHNVSAGTYNPLISTPGVGGALVYGRAIFIEVAGLANSAPGAAGTNSSQPNNGSTVNPVNSGSTGTLAQAANMIIGCSYFGCDPASAFTAPSGYTSLVNNTGTNGGNPGIWIGYRTADTAATTAVQFDLGTSSNTYYWGATVIPLPLASATGFGRLLSSSRNRLVL